MNLLFEKIFKEGGFKTLREDENWKLVEETINQNIEIGDFIVTQDINGFLPANTGLIRY